MTLVHPQTNPPTGGPDAATVRSEEVLRHDHTTAKSGRSPADRPG
jgi:hypothetical protein